MIWSGRVERDGARMPAPSPAAGALVMGTGIVATALWLDGHEALSDGLLALAALIWTATGLLLLERTRCDLAGVARDARSPAALTGVAATAVLGASASERGWKWAGIALLALALVFWLLLLAPVLAHWATPTTGESFLLVVSIESLAVLAADLGAREHADWWIDAALAGFLLGLGLYAFVLARFDLRQLLIAQGPHWIAGGALAISTLAVGRIVVAAESLHALVASVATLKTALLVLWGLSIGWLVILLASEALSARVRYDPARWSTVFPVGMYAACSFTTGAVCDAGAITQFGRVWTWVAAALWLVLFVAMIRSWSASRNQARLDRAPRARR
jgi:tellurite resistance protein TehA-like permease